ncbi:MAG: UbiA family prenyltransferase, partial [Flavobacteriia bacterium]
CIDQHKHLTFNIKSFLSFPIHKFVFFQFILLVIPISFYFINFFTFFILGISAIVGVLYSISFKIGNTRFRLKNIFLVKNFLIGIIWGNLILIGAGSISNKEILTLFVFVSIQVFIGGIIRDIPDLKKDKEANVRSFPVVFGTAKTILFLQIINLSSLAVLVIGEFSFYNLIFILIVVFWRAINLVFLKRQPFRKLWSQSANLFTCLLIFILIFTIKYVHYIF